MMRILLWIIIICKVFLSLNVLFVIDKYSNIYSYFSILLFFNFHLFWDYLLTTLKYYCDFVCVWLFDFKIVCEILIDVIEECFIKITSAWQSCFGFIWFIWLLFLLFVFTFDFVIKFSKSNKMVLLQQAILISIILFWIAINIITLLIWIMIPNKHKYKIQNTSKHRIQNLKKLSWKIFIITKK